MKPRQIHQMLPYVAPGDAIGNLALEIRQALHEWGYSSAIFAEHWDPRLANVCHSYRTYRRFSHPDNLLILHYSTGGQVNRFVLQIPDRVILYYHNITPAHYFDQANGALAQELRQARRDLANVAGRFPAICDSLYDQRELEEMGFQTLGVTPPLFSCSRPEAESDRHDAELARLRSQKENSVDWLHVGRLAPNKCIQDVIRAFYYYHTWIRPRSRLFLVGSGTDTVPYVDELRGLISRLELGESVIFTGHVNRVEPFFSSADVYVTMSEHEGFCIPLVEAMRFDVPILAYASTGIPDTVGDAGVLVRAKAFPIIAEIAEQMIADLSFRQRLIKGQRNRLVAFAPDAVRAQFQACLDRADRLQNPTGNTCP